MHGHPLSPCVDLGSVHVSEYVIVRIFFFSLPAKDNAPPFPSLRLLVPVFSLGN